MHSVKSPAWPGFFVGVVSAVILVWLHSFGSLGGGFFFGVFVVVSRWGLSVLYTIAVADLLKVAILGVKCGENHLGLSTIYVRSPNSR